MFCTIMYVLYCTVLYCEQDVYTSLVHLSRPVKVEDLYCFQYRSKSDLPQHTGWTFFDLGAEFARQGLPNNYWVTCSLNLEYRQSGSLRVPEKMA